MHQIVHLWNSANPSIVNDEEILLRGYNPETFLTGEFARKIAENQIKKLSVSSIADIYCPSKRDLYINKGKNKPTPNTVNKIETWGQKSGPFVEKFLIELLGKRPRSNNYDSIMKWSKSLLRKYSKSNKSKIESLKGIENASIKHEAGNTDWILKLFEYNSRVELGSKILHNHLKTPQSISSSQIKVKHIINPIPSQIGINTGAEPDFIISSSKLIGDIKSGYEFKDSYLLTCTGYAMAYENEKGANNPENKIDWGIIYFFPTRPNTDYVRPIKFIQVYIFQIDDNLRNYFLSKRNEAYDIVSKNDIPNFPENIEKCPSCNYRRYCKENGLALAE